MKKVLEIKEGKEIIQLSWLSSARYKIGQGIVILKFDSNLKPYLLQLKELYTSYKLENILSLKSKYSIRLYEILRSNLFKNQVSISIKDIKEMVGAKGKSYDVYANLKNKVILQAQKIFFKHQITDYEAESILKKSTDLEYIKECYRYALTQNVDNIMAYMLSLIANYNKPQANIKQDKFTNYDQRNYNFEDLEKTIRVE